MKKISSTLGTTSSNIKLHNQSAILLALLHNENISRVHLANILGVSAATITNLVSDLSQKGHIIETGLVPSEGQVGRRRRALQLVPDSGFAIGVHIDVGKVYIALTDLLGTIIDRLFFEHNLNEPNQYVLSEVNKHIHQIIERNPDKRDAIVGIGIAASGLVDTERGINLIAPNLNWCDVPIQEVLARTIDYPIIVENNVRAMAFGESLFGNARDYNVIAFIYGRIGVGAGLVLNGEVYRGAGAGAGEIGHTLLVCQDKQREELTPLEDMVSELAILTLAKERTGKSYTFSTLLESARAGDEALLSLLDERAYYLGIALTNLVNILNPELIVLGGIFREAHDLMLEKIRETIEQYAFANLGEQVEIRVTAFGNEAGMIGSAALALDTFFYRPQIFQREV